MVAVWWCDMGGGGGGVSDKEIGDGGWWCDMGACNRGLERCGWWAGWVVRVRRRRGEAGKEEEKKSMFMFSECD